MRHINLKRGSTIVGKGGQIREVIEATRWKVTYKVLFSRASRSTPTVKWKKQGTTHTIQRNSFMKWAIAELDRRCLRLTAA